MSKVGKKIIAIPQGVEVKISGNLAVVKGPKGELQLEIPSVLKIEVMDGQAVVSPGAPSKKTAALWGLEQRLLSNAVTGVSKGFEKKLELEGIGYKVALQGKDLILNLGFSYPIKFDAVPEVEFKTEKNTIIVSGINKELVGQTAAKIRSLRKPEPYKGKGIHYEGEIIKRKAGKKAVKSAF
jgi:large subunit ribosomal protein L6